MSEWNDQIIDEFRANGGRVGGPFEGAPLLLLHHVGAKSGEPRVTPMMYQAVGDDLAVFASYAGEDVHPAWYHNLLANPDVTAEVGGGTDTVALRARDLPPTSAPRSGRSRRRTTRASPATSRRPRTIPVVLLTRRDRD